VFPGTSKKIFFDNKSKPSSSGKIAVCSIGTPGISITADLIVSSGTCTPGTARVALPGAVVALGLLGSIVLFAGLRF
jgi:hypothetical protein